jgi:formamidopyrimidine-DNA glycosylase
MPELAELKIMSDYINQNVKDKVFNKSFHVLKGNNPEQFQLIDEFKVDAESFGKELIIRFYNGGVIHKISVFMGMSGNWKWVKTENWNETKYIRMRLDSIDGYSLILYGSYMGPKYKIGGFTGVKRGPDPTKEFRDFYQNVMDNIDKRAFDKPICETLLNQEYFNGIGNYLRSTILYYLDVNPFEEARKVIKENPNILSMCRDIPIKAYQLNGGQLSDWKNPFDTDYDEFQKWVFYQKGISCKDNNNRTFWFQEKWIDFCPYPTINIKSNIKSEKV